jgi:hypothetical protein
MNGRVGLRILRLLVAARTVRSMHETSGYQAWGIAT